MKMDPEIREALAAGRPVVALESAVITHGLPRPMNLEVARECEAAVREAGAVPATVAVIRGEVCAGVDAGTLAALAADPEAQKCAAPDLGAFAAAGRTAGTTVSATLAVAARCGIAVMSTGGIGGVHRGDRFDVSADLAQLARSAVVVVCSGAKAVLDLRRTLELLETLGVPVIGYGTDELPGFYTPHTGLRLRHRLDSPRDVARAVAAYRDLGYAGGMVVAQPPPASLPAGQLESATAGALALAAEQGIEGPAVTPFLLQSLADSTGGATLDLNRRLLAANARLAAEIARAMPA